MKTVKEWFEELPDGYRERALKNLRYNGEEYCMPLAICAGFIWLETSEGENFWGQVVNHYEEGTKLPPLP